MVFGMRPFSKRVGWFCIVLTFWSAFAFTTHHHTNATDSAKCTVCVIAHSSTPKAISRLTKTTFIFVTVNQPNPISAKQRIVAFALSVRPPPAV
jgi:hypothetical protein